MTLYIDYIRFRLTLFIFLILKSDEIMIDFYVVDIFYDFENYYMFYDLKEDVVQVYTFQDKLNFSYKSE